MKGRNARGLGPTPYFDMVKQDGEDGNIQQLFQFYDAAKRGTLPAVSWVIPNGKYSEHPPALISDGQAYVTGLINAIMQGPDWNSTAIFLAWNAYLYPEGIQVSISTANIHHSI